MEGVVASVLRFNKSCVVVVVVRVWLFELDLVLFPLILEVALLLNEYLTCLAFLLEEAPYIKGYWTNRLILLNRNGAVVATGLVVVKMNC